MTTQEAMRKFRVKMSGIRKNFRNQAEIIHKKIDTKRIERIKREIVGKQ